MNIKSITWFYMALAIVTEVAGTTFMKLSHGFTQFLPSILMFFCYVLSFTFLMFSLKHLDIGFAYALWSALGTLLIFFNGIFFFNEPITLLKTLSLILIIVGVMGLKQT